MGRETEKEARNERREGSERAGRERKGRECPQVAEQDMKAQCALVTMSTRSIENTFSLRLSQPVCTM